MVRASHPRRWVYVLIGVASSALFLGFAISRLRLDDIAAAFSQASWFPWLPLAMASYLTGHWVRGVRCRYLVSHEAQLSTVTATNVVVLGYAVNNIAPARLGELARAGMLSQRTGLPFVQSLSLTFIERILDGLVMLALLVVTRLMLPTTGWVTTTLSIAVPLFGTALGGILALALAPSFLLRWTSRFGQLFGAKLHDKLVAVVAQATAGAAYLRSPTASVGIAALSLLVWLFEAGMFLALMPAFGIEASIAAALLAMTITNLGILLPSTPGFIGPFHFFCMQAMTVVGVSEAVGFSYAALVHLTFYIPITAWGVAILFSYGFGLSDALQDRRAAQPFELPDPEDHLDQFEPDPDPTPSAMTFALCEALIPTEEALKETEQARVLGEVAGFVEGEIQELPLRLALLYHTGMIGVRFLTRLRHLRSFCSLPLDRRRHWVEAWAYGRLPLARQLFRLVRSTTLMAYYEHPSVRDAHAAQLVTLHTTPLPGPVSPRAPRPIDDAPPQSSDTTPEESGADA